MPTPQETTTTDLCRTLLRNVCQNTKAPEVVFMAPFQLIAKVSPEDQGRCVGKKGLNFWAMSTILWWAGTTVLQNPVGLRLLEPTEPTVKKAQPPFRPPTKWDQIDLDSLGRLVDQITWTVFKEKRPWTMEKDSEVGCLTINLWLPKYLQTPMSEPNFAEALEIYLRTVGMVRGLNIATRFEWA